MKLPYTVQRILIALRNAVCLLLLIALTSGAHAQGLQFNSNDSLMSKRTSYTVFNEPPTFRDRIELSFDLSLWDNDHLGYVFNITDTKNNSYSLTYIYNHNGSPTLNFNIDSKSNKIEIPLNLELLKKRKWFRVKADINIRQNTVAFLVNGKLYKAKDFGFEDELTPKISFGRNPHYSDVPKMAIKNLVISGDGDEYKFPLDEWKGTVVHTSDGDALGSVDHPNWLINESYFWTQKLGRSFNQVAGLNFDPATQQLLIFKSDSILRYNLQSESLNVQPFKNESPLKLFLGKSAISLKDNKLYAYEVQPRDTMHSIASLDLSTLTWQHIGKAPVKEQRHHHNTFFDRDGKDLYIFGGYGSFSYHNDFFVYKRETDKWDKVGFKGDTILPRFFSGSSQADAQNNVYIFGGYGNQSGNQIVGGRHFYDLYRIDLTNHTIKKLWEINPQEEPFVSANNLIVSKDGKYFYALCYPHEKPKTNLRLYKFSIRDGSYEVVSGVIPVTSERIESDFNLFYDARQDEFICTAQEFTSPEKSSVRIYTLTAPPVSEQVYKASQRQAPAGFGKYGPYLIGVLAIAALGGGWYFLQKRKNIKQAGDGIEDEPATGVHPAKKEVNIKPNTVYLLGEFTVYNKAAKDITYLFSPKIKQLFVLILLHSRNEQGVVSKRISNILWPDKEVTKTKNIRGVTINHLRSIVADIEGLELTFVNDTYRFQFSDNFSCDYFSVSDALDSVHNHARSSEEFVSNEFDYFSRGGLLQGIPENWLDDVKVEFEESLLHVLLPELKRIYESGDYRRSLELSRVALSIDPFNDVAIKYKLKAIRRFKGVEHARKLYDDFVADYEKSLGSHYGIPFEKICK